MNKIIINYIAIVSVLLCGSCSKDKIDVYDEEYASVTFPWNPVDIAKYPGYSAVTKKFQKVYSFWSNPSEETSVVDIPLKLIGDVRDYDRKINYEIDKDSTHVLENSYRIIEAVIPAGERYGKIAVELSKLPALDTAKLWIELVLVDSEDFMTGPSEYTRLYFVWDNQLPMPREGTFYARTYNFLINAGQSMNLANYTYYSRNAHEAILAALGWPWESEKWPAYNSRDPNGFTMYSTAQSNAYYNLLKKYLDAYELKHGEPLLHDGGLAKGQPVKPRKF